MNWYYVEAGQQAGPVDDAQLEGLASSGKIQPDTLVWREGMPNWQPFQETRPSGLRLAAVPPVMGAGQASAAAASVAADEAVCAECGGIFNKQDMIHHGNMYVCANCKPVFMQKLREGARLNTGLLNYAGIGTRFGAVFLDGLILWLVNTGINMIAGLGFARSFGGQSGAFGPMFVLVFLFQIAISLTYEVVMIGKYGATLGKMACKIRVVTPDGGKVSYPRALGRYSAKMLSSLICAIGYIIAAFDEEKRTLHDRLCDTRVVTN